MEILRLTPQQFDNFSIEHPLHTYYQTSMYGNLMQRNGFKAFYYGFLINNQLVGATLILEKKLFAHFKYGYAPRGFLADYNDKQALTEITKKLKKFLSHQSYVFLKIDPPVINNLRDNDGNILPNNTQNDIIPFLKSLGYNYFGQNKFFGTLKPRWNAILNVNNQKSEKLFDNFDPSVKNKIRKAQSRGIEIIQGNHDDIKVFYNFVAKKHYRNLRYYVDFARCFGNHLEFYFAKLNTQKYLQNIKTLYEDELRKNEQINIEIGEAGIAGKITTKLTNTKLTSDKLIATYKKELITASNLFERNPQGIIISSSAYIIDKYGVTLLIEGQNPNFKLYYPTFLTKWFVIDKYTNLGASFFDLNAITGNFSNNNKFKGLNEMKLGFNAEVTEYIGEFNLVINKGLYKLHMTTNLGKNSLSKTQ